MGSWFGTCGLSQLPIKEGEKVLLFPIQKNKNATNGSAGFSYSTNQYAPITLPIVGTYNDYGGVTAIEKNGEFVFSLFQEAVKGKEGPLLSYNKKEFERQQKINKTFTGTPKDVEELIDVYMGEPVYAGIGYMLVLDDVYESVVAEVATRKKYKSEETLRTHYTNEALFFLKEVAKQLQTPIETLYEQQKTLREAKDKDSEENFEQRIQLNQQINLHHGLYEESFSNNAFVEYFTDRNACNFLFNKLLLQTLVKTEKEKQTQLVYDYVELILFDLVMDLTRKMWTPQAGAGSQGTEQYLHKLIASRVLAREQQTIDEWFEENVAETKEDIAFGRNVTKETIW